MLKFPQPTSSSPGFSKNNNNKCWSSKSVINSINIGYSDRDKNVDISIEGIVRIKCSLCLLVAYIQKKTEKCSQG